MTKQIAFSFLLFILPFASGAREGMWIPTLLEQNIAEMQAMGFELTAEDIYSVNQSSMKDAIVHFGGGCTGELISAEGLLVTNYHCGYSEIQSHSSVENDYLTNGFWASSRNEELPNKGLSVTFLISIEDVTDKVLDGTGKLASPASVDSLVAINMEIIKRDAKEKSGYDANIKPFYEGNQFYLFLTETFTDVRLVGAPPSSIGKFGGDTDNWVWPRHTGDFSLFRIYAGKDNKPANYSPENIPYAPRSFFPIDITGIEEGDFTMVFGYPGTTQQYLPSHEVKIILEDTDPDRVAIRDIKLDILERHMEKDDETRIKYAAKHASTSNSWKKWQGEIIGLKRLKTIESKKEEEKEFAQWVASDSIRNEKFGNILPGFDSLYPIFTPISKAYTYYLECIYRGTDVFRNFQFAEKVGSMASTQQEVTMANIEDLFKDYSKEVDCEVFVKLTSKYFEDLPNLANTPPFAGIISQKDVEKKLRNLYMKSFLCDKKSMLAMAANPSSAKTKHKKEADELYRLLEALKQNFSSITNIEYWDVKQQLNALQKRYVNALLELNLGKQMYPDANSTLRVSYGKVEGFEPRNGVKFRHYTTIDGIAEKAALGIDDYHIDTKLQELITKKDFGRYVATDGTLPVCFTASNHTTGGNSGSPVINAKGHLVGINFDRCWEGTMSDIDFDPEKCRNISLDMRYMLFIIEKYAGSSHLMSEMKIIE